MKSRLATVCVVALAVGVLFAPSATAEESDVPQRIAHALASGNGQTGAELICDHGFAEDRFGLGHALSAADRIVLDHGGTEEQITRFAGAVNDAYRIAAVPRDVAATSFGVGLADIVTGYAARPEDPVGYWSKQAGIGSGILLRVGSAWVASPVPTAPCADVR